PACSCRLIGQGEDIKVIRRTRAQLRCEYSRTTRGHRRSRTYGDVLFTVHRKRGRITRYTRSEIYFPEHLAVALIKCAEASVGIASKEQATTRSNERHRGRPLLILPSTDSGLECNRLDCSHVISTRRNAIAGHD